MERMAKMDASTAKMTGSTRCQVAGALTSSRRYSGETSTSHFLERRRHSHQAAAASRAGRMSAYRTLG